MNITGAVQAYDKMLRQGGSAPGLEARDSGGADFSSMLQRAAERDPSGVAWAAVGDAYWAAQDANGAAEAYTTAIEEFDDAPARAFQRLGLLTLQTDLPRARVLLEQARLRAPNDPNMVGTLAELYLQTGDYTAALGAFEDGYQSGGYGSCNGRSSIGTSL